jgi:hypothetical protein
MNPDHVAINFHQIEYIAIGIGRTGYGTTHTGVAYRHSDGLVHLFHQAFHCDTKDGPIGREATSIQGPFFCVVPKVEPDRASAIAGLWEFIAKTGQPIGYALKDDEEAVFNEDTGRLVMPNGIGLSCSTFVLALFRSAKFPIIDTHGWPTNRPGDREAQESLVTMLEMLCNDASHVEAVRKEIGCERIRPEEIAGAALYSGPSVRYQEVEDAGLFILGGLCVRSHFP